MNKNNRRAWQGRWQSRCSALLGVMGFNREVQSHDAHPADSENPKPESVHQCSHIELRRMTAMSLQGLGLVNANERCVVWVLDSPNLKQPRFRLLLELLQIWPWRLWQASPYLETLGTRLLFCVRDSYIILRAILTPNVQSSGTRDQMT